MVSKVVYSPKSIKQIKRIGQRDQSKVKKKIKILKQNPLSGKALRGELKGYFSLRAWPLRIIYQYFPKHNQVHVVNIEYRGRVYK